MEAYTCKCGRNVWSLYPDIMVCDWCSQSYYIQQDRLRNSILPPIGLFNHNPMNYAYSIPDENQVQKKHEGFVAKVTKKICDD